MLHAASLFSPEAQQRKVSLLCNEVLDVVSRWQSTGRTGLALAMEVCNLQLASEASSRSWMLPSVDGIHESTMVDAHDAEVFMSVRNKMISLRAVMDHLVTLHNRLRAAAFDLELLHDRETDYKSSITASSLTTSSTCRGPVLTSAVGENQPKSPEVSPFYRRFQRKQKSQQLTFTVASLGQCCEATWQIDAMLSRELAVRDRIVSSIAIMSGGREQVQLYMAAWQAEPFVSIEGLATATSMLRSVADAEE